MLNLSRRPQDAVRWPMVSLAIGVALLAALVAIFVFGFYTLGTCFYDYRVSVRSASGSLIRDVRGRAYYDIAEAREIAEDSKVRLSSDNDENAFDGKSLCISGLFTIESYCLDLITTGSPPRYLALQVDYKDGRRENKLVEIPEGPGIRSIAVEVP